MKQVAPGLIGFIAQAEELVAGDGRRLHADGERPRGQAHAMLSSTSVAPCAAAYPKALFPSLSGTTEPAPAFNKGAITFAARYFAAISSTVTARAPV